MGLGFHKWNEVNSLKNRKVKEEDCQRFEELEQEETPNKFLTYLFPNGTTTIPDDYIFDQYDWNNPHQVDWDDIYYPERHENFVYCGIPCGVTYKIDDVTMTSIISLLLRNTNMHFCRFVRIDLEENPFREWYAAFEPWFEGKTPWSRKVDDHYFNKIIHMEYVQKNLAHFIHCFRIKDEYKVDFMCAQTTVQEGRKIMDQIHLVVRQEWNLGYFGEDISWMSFDTQFHWE